MKKLAIIGASHFQNPLILKAKEMGIETHVFAWECGDVGENTADFFYPVSIIEKDEVLRKCQEIGVDGITTVASDLANITVAYVADKMGLPGNSVEAVAKSTNKILMRRTFEKNGDPSPKSIVVDSDTDLPALDISYPAIVKPTDRSGSRGITKLESPEGLREAVERAFEEGFEKKALVEEFAEGREFSVEFISWRGEHRFLSITEKFTSGAPMFIETGHLEPARITDEEKRQAEEVVIHALTSLGVQCGPSHSELKIAPDGTIRIIEIGSRMGGDHIGSDLVCLSTGYDFLRATIECALGVEPAVPQQGQARSAAIRFIFSQNDLDALNLMKDKVPELLYFESPISEFDHKIVDSSSRYGYFIFSGDALKDIEAYLPPHEEEPA